jgi:uncharacterized membrane protein YeaQ/YmgE (transglycosylase-associated protein family)
MNVTVDQVIVWVIVGAMAGSLVGMLVTRSKEGYGRLANLAIGMAGAVVGGLAFKALKIDLGLGDIQFSAEDLASAVIGTVTLLLAIWLFGKARKKKG